MAMDRWIRRHLVVWLVPIVVSAAMDSAEAARQWHYTYTDSGRVESIDGPRTDVRDVTTFEYDDSGNRVRVINALGHVTAITRHDEAGRPLHIVDPNGAETRLTYGRRGRVTAVTVAGATTVFGYDSVGALTSVTLPGGGEVEYEYDAARRLTAITDPTGNRIEFTLDRAGNRVGEKHYGPGGQLAYKHRRVYDALSRLIEQIGAVGQSTRYDHDPNGNRTDIIDARGNAANYAFDALDRLVRQTDAAGARTRIHHEPNNAPASVTDPRGNATEYEYDRLGNRIAVRSPDSGTTTFEHDNAGNVVRRTDANGVVTHYEYDALNRLTAIRYPATPSYDVRLTYDEGDVAHGIGRLTRVVEAVRPHHRGARGQTTTRYGYTARARIARTTVRREHGRMRYTVEYGHDAAGRLTRVQYPSGRRVRYARDASGRVRAVTSATESVTRTLADDIVYQPFRGPRRLDFGNGRREKRRYDLDGRLVEVTLAAGRSAGRTLSWRYGFDATGNVATIDGPSGESAFEYDVVDRLIGARSTSRALYRYGYDAVGNRTRYWRDATRERLKYSPTSNRLSNRAGSAYLHDAAGNRLSDGRHTYTYSPNNRLERVRGEAGRVSYGYDFRGRRVYKRTRGERTVYVYDPRGRLLGEYDHRGRMRREYVYLGRRPLAQIDRNRRRDRLTYLHTDHLGTPRRGTDTKGRVVWRWRNASPFGANPAESDPDGDGGAVTVNLRFPGQYFDAETGLHYNYFRYYDPTAGRYLTSDPIGLAGGLNTYAYVAANPISIVDPKGLATWDVVDAFEVGMVAGVGGQYVVYKLQSPCNSNGKQYTISVHAVGPSAGLGLKCKMCSTAPPKVPFGGSFDDHSDEPDPSAFNGSYLSVSGGAQIGGFGGNYGDTVLGHATSGFSFSPSIGFGTAGAEVSGTIGTSTVLDIEIEDCECSN